MVWSNKVADLKTKSRQRYGEEDRKLLCKKCGAVMRDHEPHTTDGEFYHPDNDCANRGKSFDWELRPHLTTLKNGKKSLWSSKGRHTSGITQYVPKKYARARKRGAKQASKHRPK